MAPMESKSWCFPGQLLVLMLAGWINRHQQAVIAYQREETKVLREMLVASACDSPMVNVVALH